VLRSRLLVILLRGRLVIVLLRNSLLIVLLSRSELLLVLIKLSVFGQRVRERASFLVGVLTLMGVLRLRRLLSRGILRHSYSFR